MTSMKAPISHGTPMFGSTLASGVIKAPAIAARPQPMPKVIEAHARAVDAEPSAPESRS